MSNKTRKLTAVLLAFVTCFSVLTFSPFNIKAEASGETFIIDVGHGGEDPGALGPGGREEADDVLKLALRVGEILRPYTTFVFTRTTDATLSLSQRSSMANAGGYDYIISIHRNAFGDSAAKGLEVWWYSGTKGGNPSACQRFATSVYNSVMEQVPVWTERGVKDGNLHMCRQPYMPSCLIETGFITNTEDNRIFDQYFEQNAIGIANGMLKMIGKSVDSSAVTTNKLDGATPISMGEDFCAYIRHASSGKYITDVNDNLQVEPGKFEQTQTWLDQTQRWHFLYNKDDGTYSIYNDAKNKWFDVSGGVYEDGTNMQLWEGNALDTQRFYVYYTKGHFYMRTKASTKVLDVAADTGNVALWGDNTGTDEVSSAARAFEILKINLDYSNWYLNYGTEEIVYIRNVDSGKLMTGKSDLDVYFGDALYTNDQKWKLLRRPDGSYEFVHLATGKYLDVSQGDIASGTTVNLWDCNGHRAQGFYILPSDVEDYVLIKPCYSENVLDMGAGVGDLAIYPPRLDLEVPRAAQIFEIVFEKIEGNTVPAENLGNEFEAYVVDKLYKQAFTDMGNMVLESHQFTQADNQLFKFYYDASTNSYEIVGNSGKALDVTMTGYRDGDVVGLYDRNNWVAQRFRLHKVGEYYAISPIYTNKLLDLHADNKTTIQLCGATRNDHRLFELVFKSSEDTLVLKDSSSYSKDGTDLYKVASGQTASGLLGNFDNENAEVWNTNGTKVTGTAKVGTGYTVNLIINGQKLDSVTVIINGDVTGDGVVDATDYLRIKGIFLETYKASGAYAKAADVDGTGKTDSTDYLRVKGHFLETYNLYK